MKNFHKDLPMQPLYEKLKLFYLGKEAKTNTPVVYENKDLTTHALIIGMTGSGKTGLGIGLIEEATLDSIPSIIIDPKGDMGNLLLTFPDFKGSSFRPWIDENEASNKGLSADEYAKQTASMWQKGIESFEQDKSRVERFKTNGDFTIFTPGSSAGVGVALISDFHCPADEIMEDRDLLNSIVSSTVTSILSLIDVDSDPISGKEHILIASIFMNAYQKGKNLSLEELISSIVTPPFKKIGVFALDTFFPQQNRMALAMKLNAVMASPAFASWREGEPLNIDNLLFTKEGKTRVNIFSIAHLNDKERMFFVTLLLNEFLGWMRRQEGSSRLKVMLYMDEIFGFFPPSKNPPSKQPMLTLLKQARAFGVGVVLSTQNPVDLDYKGLSNIGTWFIGRLQTTQDKERVISGLQGIKGSEYSKKDLMELLSNIKKRNFLLKNIHEEGLIVFATRWVLSYLKGPLTRAQIEFLMEDKKVLPPKVKAKQSTKQEKTSQIQPILNRNIEQNFSYYSQSETYQLAPFLVCSSSVKFVNAKNSIDTQEEVWVKIPLHVKENSIVWDNKEEYEAVDLETKSRNNSSFYSLPNFILELKSLKGIEKEFKDHLYRNEKFPLFFIEELKLTSKANESEEAFWTRVQDRLGELEDEAMEKLTKEYEKKKLTLEKRLDTFANRLDKEKSDVSSQTTNTIISIGASVLGAIFGRSLVSKTNVTKAASGIKSAGRILKEKRDVKRVEESIEKLELELEDLLEDFSQEANNLKERYKRENYKLDTLHVKPRRADIYNTKLFLLWEEE